MTSTQEGDVKLFQTIDDGNITIEDGITEMSGGIETATYLALFGGNEQDDGRDDNPNNWWGNVGENEPARQYRSETQYILRSLPATTANLGRLEDAAIRDLQFFLDENIASSVSVVASIPGLNKIKLTIAIEAEGEESNFEFTENWKVLL